MKKTEAKSEIGGALVDLFWQRDEKALSGTAEAYGHLFYQIALNVTENKSDAEEVVNDTFVKLWNSIPPNRPDNLSGYGCKIARNLAVSRVRALRAQKRPEVVAELDEALPSGIPDDTDASALAALIERFLDSLRERDRTVFMMRYFEERTSESIARETGISAPGIRTILKRTRDRLKKYLEKEGYTP